MSKPRFFTGLQPTGTLTLGNYLGVIKHILDLQEKDTHEIIIMIADLHALTIPNRTLDYQKNCCEMAALLYACGLQTEKCKVFIQSEVKEHLELSYLLSPHVTVGKLGDMIQFKDKMEKEGTGNLALLSYPVLMAADIFLYDADLVIVGQDQKQHTELATKLADKFNNFCGQKTLKIPTFEIPKQGGKIMGLKNPTKKMSKSENDYIGLLDEPKEIEEKIIKRTLTDSEEGISYDPEKRPGISNLLTIYALLNNQKIEKVKEELKRLNHYQFKLRLIDLLNKKLVPIQKSYQEYLPKISEILKKNNKYLKILAEKKITIIKKELKLNYERS